MTTARHRARRVPWTARLALLAALLQGLTEWLALQRAYGLRRLH